jgi:hypothetical protein
MSSERVPVPEFRQIRGIDNTSNPVRVSSSKMRHFLSLVNYYTDREGMLHTRDGFNQSISGSNIHSLFEDVFIEGSTLKQFTGNGSIALTTLSTTHEAEYARSSDRIFLTNETDIGYIKDYRYTPFLGTGKTYKIRMPAGQLIEHYRGRLYVAKGSKVYISDGIAYGVTDIRDGFLRFGGYVTMFKAVTSGIYVSCSGATFFLAGESPDKFVSKRVLGCAAIQGSALAIEDININLSFFRRLPQGELVALWLGSDGYVYIGFSDGVVRVVSEYMMSVDPSNKARACFRMVGSTPQYVVTIQTEAFTGQITTSQLSQGTIGF